MVVGGGGSITSDAYSVRVFRGRVRYVDPDVGSLLRVQCSVNPQDGGGLVVGVTFYSWEG